MSKFTAIHIPLLKLAFPLVIIQLCQASLGLVDTLVAGQYHYRDLAAVGLGSSIWTPVFVFCTGVLYVLVPKISALTSSGQHQQGAILFAQGRKIALVLSVLAFVFIQALAWLSSYLVHDPEVAVITKNYLHWVAFAMPSLGYLLLYRFISEGSSRLKPIIITGFILLMVNALLNYWFVNGVAFIPAMGGAGTGLATTVSAYIALIVMRSLVSASLPEMTKAPRVFIPMRECMGLLKAGLPIGITLVLQILALATLAFFASALGVQVIAAHQIVMNMAMVIVMIPLALASATTISIAHYQATFDWRSKQITGLAAALMTVVYSGCVALVLLLLGRTLVGLFSHDILVVSIASQLIIYVIIFQLFDAIQMVASGILRGLEEFIKPFLVILVTYWCVIIPISYIIGVKGWLSGSPNIEGVWLTLAVGMIFAAAVLVRYAYRYLQEKNRT